MIDSAREQAQRGFLGHGLDMAHQVGEEAVVEQARIKARAGNPFPLLALQWEEDFVVTDPEEAQYFQGSLDDPDNPCLRIDPWQRQVLTAAFDVTVGEVAMKGCTGAGKGFTAAVIANLLFDAFNPCRINVTSETFRHASENLFGEISVWRGKMKRPGPGNLISVALNDTKRHYITVLNPSPHGAGEAFSGMHSEMTVYFFDEASGIPEIHYTNALKNARKIFALSNPRITEGWFRDLYRPLRGEGSKEEMNQRENETNYCQGRIGRRLCVTIPGDACANVRFGRIKNPVAPRRGVVIGENEYGPSERISDEDFKKVKALIPRQIDLEQYQSIIDTSKEPWEVECYAHARFPTEDPVRQVILASHLDRHLLEWTKRNGRINVTCFGLDVARSKSGDETVLAPGGVDGLAKLIKWQDDDNMRHVKKILKIARDEFGVDLTEGNNPVCIDYAGGYGAGVGDRLQELGVWVMKFQPAGRATVEPGLYGNARAEWYMLLGRRFDPNDNWQTKPWAIPNDNKLVEELTAPVKYPTRGGTSWMIEPKEGIKKRLGRSPDSADAVVCLYRAVFERYQLLKILQQRVPDDLIAEGVEEKPIILGKTLDNPRIRHACDPWVPKIDTEQKATEPPVPMTEGNEVNSIDDMLTEFEAFVSGGENGQRQTHRERLQDILEDENW